MCIKGKGDGPFACLALKNTIFRRSSRASTVLSLTVAIASVCSKDSSVLVPPSRSSYYGLNSQN